MSIPPAAAVLRLQLLELLYGDDAVRVAGLVEPRLQAMGTAAPRTPWSHDDVWLIAYPDQFQSRTSLQSGEHPLETLGEVLTRDLADVCSGVHVLPFYPWSSDDGFSVIDHASVEPTYGTWDDVTRLARNHRLMVDAVINHASVESEWFRRFLADEVPYDQYFPVFEPDTDVSAVVRPRTHPLLTMFDTARGPRSVWTTFSADQADLNYRAADVLLEVLDLMFLYVSRGAAVIRLDAIGFLWKDPSRSSIHLPETHTVIQLIRSCLDEVAPGTLLISETNVPHVENVSYFHDDPNEVHAVYQFALAPLVAEAVLTSDVTVLVAWAQTIGPLVTEQQSFVNFLASHDGIGLRPVEGLLSAERIGGLVAACERVGGQVSFRTGADGTSVAYELNTTWFDLLSDEVDEETAIARHLATHAVMLALPGVPAIYAHSLFGSSNDQAGFERTGEKRSLNRRRFTDWEAYRATLRPDSQARARRVLDGIGLLAKERRSCPAFHPEGACHVEELAPGVLSIGRRYGDHEAEWVISLSSHPTNVSATTMGGAPSSLRLEPYEVSFVSTQPS